MKSVSKQAFFTPVHTCYLPVVLRGIMVVILSFIITDNIDSKEFTLFAVTFSVFPYHQPIEKTKSKLQDSKKDNNKTGLKIYRRTNVDSIAIKDSVRSETDTTTSESKKIESGNQYLNFSRALLDSILITNPGYSKLILKERIKNLKDTVSIRQQWEKRINDEIHKYLREHYPEGSEHAINKYTGPGINIPIDDLIDVIKGIF